MSQVRLCLGKHLSHSSLRPTFELRSKDDMTDWHHPRTAAVHPHSQVYRLVVHQADGRSRRWR